MKRRLLLTTALLLGIGWLNRGRDAAGADSRLGRTARPSETAPLKGTATQDKVQPPPLGETQRDGGGRALDDKREKDGLLGGPAAGGLLGGPAAGGLPGGSSGASSSGTGLPNVDGPAVYGNTTPGFTPRWIDLSSSRGAPVNGGYLPPYGAQRPCARPPTSLWYELAESPYYTAQTGFYQEELPARLCTNGAPLHSGANPEGTEFHWYCRDLADPAKVGCHNAVYLRRDGRCGTPQGAREYFDSGNAGIGSVDTMQQGHEGSIHWGRYEPTLCSVGLGHLSLKLFEGFSRDGVGVVHMEEWPFLDPETGIMHWDCNGGGNMVASCVFDPSTGAFTEEIKPMFSFLNPGRYPAFGAENWSREDKAEFDRGEGRFWRD